MQQELLKLSSVLDSACTIHDAHQTRKVFRKIHLLSTRGHDLSPLAGKILKFLSYNDIAVKKTIYFFIQRSCNKPDVALLALNALLKDTRDPNPFYRALSVNTLVSSPLVAEQGLHYVITALDDASAHVRRSAVASCCELYNNFPKVVEEREVIDKLYGMILDQDPIVIMLCLNALDYMLKSEGGITINKKIAHYLLTKLGAFQQWGLLRVFELLLKYKPESEHEALTFINCLDEYLTANSVAVQIAAFHLFCSTLSGTLDHLLHDGLEQVWSKLRIQLVFGEEEVTQNILDWVEPHVESYADIFTPYWRQFCCHFTESPSTKCKRIQILEQLANEKTADEIAEELMAYCPSVDIEVNKLVLKVLVDLTNKFSSLNDKVVSYLLVLLEAPEESLVSEVLSAACQLKVASQQDVQQQILEAVVRRDWTYASTSAKCIVLTTISEYGRELEQAPYVLEEYVENLNAEEDVLVKHSLLNTALRLFFARPPEMQTILGSLLDALSKDSDPFLRQQAILYYRLLEDDMETAEKVLKC
ncbi:AP-4 complex subunit beta-1-like [Ornithodoros turicata]|uniref:AP-4 complex subunit beta-1-like n=1 Tax=Ornithodoros turicata TaxID=34597 RepID=UPI003139BB9E